MLKCDPEMLDKDEQIRSYFRKRRLNSSSSRPIESDLSLLNLSDSSDDEEEESKMGVGSAANPFLHSSTKGLDDDIYESSIQTMLSLNKTNHLEQKWIIISRSILDAIRSYKQSNLLGQPGNSRGISQGALTSILEHVISACYLRDSEFSLHLNLVFLMMILQKHVVQISGLQSVCRYLGNLSKTIS